MGHTYQATCRACGHEFKASEGGGRRFERLRCDACGAAQTIAHKEIGEPFEQYVRDLEATWDIDPDEEARRAEEQVSAAFHRAVESMVGRCSCGGQFRFGAPVRCPECRSPDIERGETLRLYD